MTDPHASDRRLARADALLREHAVGFERVRAAGHERDILVVEGALAAADRLATLAAAIKPLGFRYITVDLRSGAGADA